MLERLKLRLEIGTDEEDELLEDIIESAKALFLSSRYPTTQYPTDEDGDPIIQPRWNDWILRCAIEMYSKMGAESQTGMVENSISRSWDSGTISLSLMSEIAPVAGIAR